MGLHQLVDGVGLGERHHDGAWGHHVGCHQALEAEKALEQPRFAVTEHAFLGADVGQRRQLLATDVTLLLAPGEQLGEPLRQQHEWIQQVDQRLQHPAHQRRQSTPVRSTQGLGDDLAQDQDPQGQHRGEHPDRTVAEVGSRLCAGAGRADRVGDGVERQDRSERPVDVGLELTQPLGRIRLRRLQRPDVRRSDAQQHRLHDRAQERHADRQRDEDEQQCE